MGEKDFSCSPAILFVGMCLVFSAADFEWMPDLGLLAASLDTGLAEADYFADDLSCAAAGGLFVVEQVADDIALHKEFDAQDADAALSELLHGVDALDSTRRSLFSESPDAAMK